MKKLTYSYCAALTTGPLVNVATLTRHYDFYDDATRLVGRLNVNLSL
jgi:hypothetical protein